MLLSILSNAADVNSFIEVWTKFYDHGNEPMYEETIALKEFLPEDIITLYYWKNNMKGKLASSKKTFVQKINENIHHVNALKLAFDKKIYMKVFGKLPAIWGLLLLHVVVPSEYPIFDQHVYRAFTFMTSQGIQKLPVNAKRRYKIYFEEYTPFFNEL
jgi:hypothetical protein